MTNLQDLNDALAHLKDAAQDGKFDKSTPSRIAMDFEVNTHLLTRKFEEKYNLSPQQYNENYLENMRAKKERKLAELDVLECRLRGVEKAGEELRSVSISGFDEGTYKVYKREYDQVVLAEELVTPDQLKELNTFLNAKGDAGHQPVQVYASLLKKVLERGLASPSETAVSLLVDNSGSLRGKPIARVASAVKHLAGVFSEVGLKSEVIGFTTASWKGGKSREDWQRAGLPSNPGRLSDLRLISYKDFASPFGQIDRNFAAMLKEGLLKENIDGEALYFTHQQLLKRPEPHKFLLVISDGSPVDDSTLSVNRADYLSRHLKGVIAEIEKQKSVCLSAVGLERDVSDYFPNSNWAKNPEELFDVVFDKLLFDIDQLS